MEGLASRREGGPLGRGGNIAYETRIELDTGGHPEQHQRLTYGRYLFEAAPPRLVFMKPPSPRRSLLVTPSSSNLGYTLVYTVEFGVSLAVELDFFFPTFVAAPNK